MKFETTLSIAEIEAIQTGNCKAPHDILGMHEIIEDEKAKLVVRIMCPGVVKATVIAMEDKEKTYPLHPIGEAGLYEGVMGRRKKYFRYKVECEDKEGNKWFYIDPYQFDFASDDFNLLKEGIDYNIYNKLGAKIKEVEGIKGVYFAVWAPNAKRVSVIGDFNNWDGRRHCMKFIDYCGVWELFIPGVVKGDKYKFEIKTKDDVILYKADPFAAYSELRPNNASIVYDLNKYKWKDAKWIKQRERKEYYKEAVSIYEVHIGSWKKHPDGSYYTYREAANELAEYVKSMNFTHIELMGIMEYPLDESWGYQVTGYFAPTSRYGTPDDFKYFVDTMHKNNIGVLLDWVPAHFPRDSFALEKFDGTALYEHHNSIQSSHPEWGTLIFNYQRNEVKLFLIASALFWLDYYHIDGIRVDAVASMLYLDYGRTNGEFIPNCYGGNVNLEAVEFIKTLNSATYSKFPGIMMIAEESTAWEGVTRPVSYGGLGFGFKWNMGWMHDFIDYMKIDPFFRKYEHNKLTFSIMYAFSENFVLPLSHDEVVHGKSCMLYKMPGDEWRKFANLRIVYGYMYTHPGKKMLFMGNEFAKTSEWNEKVELDWELLQYELHKGMQAFVKDLNELYRNYKSLWEVDYEYGGFEWIDCHNWEQSIISFIRKSKNRDEKLVIVINFTPEVRKNFILGVEDEGVYEEIFNSDSAQYGGSGVINEPVRTRNMSWNDKPYSIEVTVPPLAISIYKLSY